MEKVARDFSWIIVILVLIVSLIFAKIEFIQWQYVETNGILDAFKKISKTFQITPALVIIYFCVIANLSTRNTNK